jgi:hypothetical protein
MAFGGNQKPGVATIMKGFGDGIQANYIAIKVGGALQVLNIKGNMVKAGARFGRNVLPNCPISERKYQQEAKNSQAIFHIIN